MEGEARWTCPHCLKSYSKNYRYKNHIAKCVSHNMKLDAQEEVSQMAIDELKQQLKAELKDEMILLLTELSQTVSKSSEATGRSVMTAREAIAPPPLPSQIPPPQAQKKYLKLDLVSKMF